MVRLTKISFKTFHRISPATKTGIALFTGLLAVSVFLFPDVARNAKAAIGDSTSASLDAFPITVPTVRYGFALDTFQTKEGVFKSGEVLGNLLGDYGIGPVAIQTLLDNSTGQFSVRDLRAGKPYLLLSKDTSKGLDYMIYEPSLYEYFVFHLQDSLHVEHIKRPVVVVPQIAEGQIESSLWAAMEKNGASPALIAKLEDALQWSIDFHHLQKDDEFKALYDQHFVENQMVDPGKVYAASYKTGDKTIYAIHFEHKGENGYYDLEGRPMNKGFLKAPLKFSRISSHFNMSRLHPILRRVRPHLGTDYAAPYGTPILSVGNGVVIEAGFKGGNGNYVKIQHNKRITTQYLHMQGFARGIRRGVQVSQGQVIGYVGSTGLATGPHVCFRFWMDGKQVNHLKFNFPPPEPLPKEELPAFFQHRDSLLQKLGVDATVLKKAADSNRLAER